LVCFAFVAGALLLKHIVVFLALTALVHVVGIRRALVLMLAAGCVVMLSMLPFAVGNERASLHILENVVLYSGYANGYGLNAMFPRWLVSAIFYGAMLYVCLSARKRPLVDALSYTMTVYMLLTPGFAVTHAALMIALWAMTSPKMALVGGIPLTAVMVLRPYAEYADGLGAVQNLFWLMCLWACFRDRVPVRK
jgi:hypothetical protein